MNMRSAVDRCFGQLWADTTCSARRQPSLTDEFSAPKRKYSLYADLVESSSRVVLGLPDRRLPSLRSPKDRAGLWAQIVALGRRHALLLIRHPQLIWTNLVTSICVACTCAWAFNGVDMTLKGGLQQRMGLLFVVGMLRRTRS